MGGSDPTGAQKTTTDVYNFENGLWHNLAPLEINDEEHFGQCSAQLYFGRNGQRLILAAIDFTLPEKVELQVTKIDATKWTILNVFARPSTCMHHGHLLIFKGILLYFYDKIYDGSGGIYFHKNFTYQPLKCALSDVSVSSVMVV